MNPLLETRDSNTHFLQTVKEEELINLKRENGLVATAWYDLSGRIQLNSVVLQRRNDTPRSFLNKQRKLLSSRMV
jgi:protein HOOK3